MNFDRGNFIKYIFVLQLNIDNCSKVSAISDGEPFESTFKTQQRVAYSVCILMLRTSTADNVLETVAHILMFVESLWILSSLASFLF